MNPLLLVLAQSAQHRRWESLRRNFANEDPVSFDISGLWIIGVALACLLLLLFAARLHDEGRLRFLSDPGSRLLGRCLRQLGVGMGDRLLMRWLARHCGLEHPAAMLLSSELLERYTAAGADHLTTHALRQWARRRSRQVARQVFGPEE